MKMLEGTKYFYALIHALQQLDPDDELVYQDHVINPDVKCISFQGTNRHVQITEGLFTTEIKYLCAAEERELVISVASMDMVDEIAERIVTYLHGYGTKI